MSKIYSKRKKIYILWAIVLGLLLTAPIGCDAPDDQFTVGLAAFIGTNEISRQGFKDGMVQQGYIEGKNIKYIYVEVPDEENDQLINSALKDFLSQDIDLILATGKLIQYIKALSEENIPIIFLGDSHPVEEGLVQSINHPGGIVTGVKVADNIPKALEWLITVIDGAKKIYLPYSKEFQISTIELPQLNEMSLKMGVEVVFHEIKSVEETIATIETLPDDIDAIFMIPSKILNARNNELSLAAIKRGIPTGAALKLDEDVLVTFSNDFYSIGLKAARLAHQIRLGVKPQNIPVETGDVTLTINLKTAEKIGLSISDDILIQATTIIR